MIDLEALKESLYDMPDDHVVDIIKTLSFHHYSPVVLAYATWDEMMSSASIADIDDRHTFTVAEQRELCKSVEESICEVVIPMIVSVLRSKIEDFLLIRQTEQQHFADKQ